MKAIVAKYFLLTAVLLSMAPVHAVEFRGVVGMGYDAGGDTLFTATYTDGSTSDIKANAGFNFNAGAVMVTGDFETQLTAGWKFDGIKQASNGTANLTVIPVELAEFYRAGNIRMGLGLIYHSSPTLKVDISGYSGNGTYKYKDAMGYIAQIGWSPAGKPTYSIDLRYTAIKYVPSNYATTSDFSGNSLGLGASFYF
jgi:hypothetical protein